MTYNLIPAWKTDHWYRELERCAPFDIYHTAQYHLAVQDEGVPMLFVCEYGVLPFIAKGGSATSVYGYPGPLVDRIYRDKFQELAKTDFQEALQELAKTDFQEALKECFTKLGIKGFQTRLHPLINNSWLLAGMCKIEQVGTTVAIDLRKPRSEQLAEISKGHKADIKKVSHLVVEGDRHFSRMGAFVNAYRETMDRAGASKEYYFSDSYFSRLAAMGEKCHAVSLWHAWDKDEIVSSAMFFTSNGFVQYHLSATPNEHVKAQGAKAIISFMIPLMRSSGYDWLHLGGGLGGAEDDPLFTFKKGFSRTRLPFCVARWEG